MTLRIKWSHTAFQELRRTREIGVVLAESAADIASACGPGYASSGAEAGRTRLRAGVYTETAEAMVDNATHNTLISNLGAGKI